jgi:hypothetical protein
MKTTQTTTAAQFNTNNADSLLRDMAFVLRLTRKVKAEMLVELKREIEDGCTGDHPAESFAV